MPYDPEGPVAKQFTPLLVNELTTAFNIPDDAQDTAEYINMLIGQNRAPTEICADVKEIINIPIDEVFMGRVFDEIGRLEEVHAQQNQTKQPAEAQLEYQPQPAAFAPEIQQQNQPQSQPQNQPQIQPQSQPQSQPQIQPQGQPEPQPSAANVAPGFPQPVRGDPFQPTLLVPNTESAVAPVVGTANVFSTPSGPSGAPQFPSGPQGKKLSAHDQKYNHVNFSRQSTDFKRGGGVGKPSRAVAKGSGISKDYVCGSNGKTQRKSFGLQNAANLQKALALASPDSVNVQPFAPRAPKGRCPDFPHCRNRECQLSHPTKKCFAYPKCPNPPGTCDYLHPSEDGELMQELEKTKEQFLDRKNQKYAALQVTLCKYGILCSKELCPFGHPTPANQDAKVIIQKWCKENKNCQNPSCDYAHSSPNYQTLARAPVAASKPVMQKYAQMPAYSNYATQRSPTTLEQCKFGWNCSNQVCPKRHATSHVACRAGYSCARMDCTFNHPIDEDCRFGNECKNSPCYFKHPDGREKALFATPHNAPHPIVERPFAVAEDQVMEQATQI